MIISLNIGHYVLNIATSNKVDTEMAFSMGAHWSRFGIDLTLS